MRSIFLSGCAAMLALTAIAAAPAMAEPLHSGGVVITRGGGNVNVAKGKFGEADQAVTTLGGVASGHGRAITNGGNNRNIASGKNSFAGQDVTTVGGFASGRGRAITSGGNNLNTARGFGSTALQSVTTAGRLGLRPSWPVADPRRLQLQPRGRQVLPGRPAGADPRRQRRPRQEPAFGGHNQNKALGFGSSASQQVITAGQ